MTKKTDIEKLHLSSLVIEKIDNEPEDFIFKVCKDF